MTEYMGKMYPEYSDVRVSCMNMDTDADGYVSCTATAIRAEGASREEFIKECAAGIHSAFNEGCRTPKFRQVLQAR